MARPFMLGNHCSSAYAGGPLFTPRTAKIPVRVALLSLLLLPAIATTAQPPMGGMWGAASIDVKQYNAENQMKRLVKRYKLTDGQKSTIQPILADQEKQVHQLGEDDSLSDRDWVAAVRAVHRETVLKVKAQMTDAQASKYIKDEEKQAKDDEDEDRMPFG